jgi:hypothetical protein
VRYKQWEKALRKRQGSGDIHIRAGDDDVNVMKQRGQMRALGTWYDNAFNTDLGVDNIKWQLGRSTERRPGCGFGHLQLLHWHGIRSYPASHRHLIPNKNGV